MKAATFNNERDDLLLQQMQLLSSQFSQRAIANTLLVRGRLLLKWRLAIWAPRGAQSLLPIKILPPLGIRLMYNSSLRICELAMPVALLANRSRERLEQIERSTIAEQDLRLQAIEGERAQVSTPLCASAWNSWLRSFLQHYLQLQQRQNIIRHPGPQPGDIGAEIEQVCASHHGFQRLAMPVRGVRLGTPAGLSSNQIRAGSPGAIAPLANRTNGILLPLLFENSLAGARVPISEVKNLLQKEIETHIKQHQQARAPQPGQTRPRPVVSSFDRLPRPPYP